MLNFDRILIVGDSFCQNRQSASDWPIYLGKLLGLPVLGKGVGGNSWWTNQIFLKQFKEQKTNTLLIVIHTESARLPNDFKLAVTPSVLAPDLKPEQNALANNLKLFQLAQDFYKSKLFSVDFYEWAQQAWIQELDSNKEYYNIIHIPAFDTVNLLNVKNGIVLLPSSDLRSLRALSDLEIIYNEGEWRWYGPDSRSNHLKDGNNIKLAEAVANLAREITPSDSGLKYFNNLDQWDFTPVKFKSRKLPVWNNYAQDL
jgi:hypothetical protein